MEHLTDDPTQARKRPVNLTIRTDLLALAKSLNLNTSQAAEAGIREAIRRAQETTWLEKHKDALEACNARICADGPLLPPVWNRP